MVAGRLVAAAIGALGVIGGAIAWAQIGEVVADAPTPRDTAAIAIEQAPPHRAGPIDYRRLDDRLTRVAAADGMVGLAVAIVEDGEIRFLKGYGETVEGTGDPVTPNTVFRWASVSKGAAADMVAKLAAEGRLSLDAPVAHYAPSLRLPGGAEQRATVADLLAHQLGLFGHAQDGKLEDGLDAAVLRRELATLNAICAPGTCHAYQNVAYDAASEIVARATGASYQDAMRERLFGPLGMRSASLTLPGLTGSPSWAQPHVGGAHPQPVPLSDAYYRVPAAGGVNSSVKDLALWMQAQMGLAPEVLSQAALDRVQTPRVATPGENGRMRRFSERLRDSHYGLGWRTYSYAGHKVVGHRGGVKGYRSLVLFDPVRKTGVAALWNAPSNKPSGIEFEVLDMLYRLPTKDWMELDGSTAPAAPANEAA